MKLYFQINPIIVGIKPKTPDKKTSGHMTYEDADHIHIIHAYASSSGGWGYISKVYSEIIFKELI